MDVRRLLYPDPDRTGSLGLLLVRIATAIVLVPHGFMKLLDGSQGLTAGLAAKGVPLAPLFAWCATLGELLGGLLVALGLLTRPAAVAAAFTMAVAWFTAHLPQAAAIGTGQGTPFEYPFLLSLLYASIAVAGAGRYSLDARLFGGRTGGT